MQIKVDIQVEPMEPWQRNRLAKMVEKFREDLKGIQYEGDSAALFEVHEVKSDEQIEAEREDAQCLPSMTVTGGIRNAD